MICFYRFIKLKIEKQYDVSAYNIVDFQTQSNNIFQYYCGDDM